ncbi:hypothetical protein SAMN04488693_105101 [Arthrobacter subterraneus]|uniref:Uncharacterized protein n=1 Tax=Arthrobacter subterraneus TaxID=335973 RepID=A0A1G8H6Y8_9MICC|nr:hypothetical protein [Arthrobacter subterraneus]SDI02418.1 hypothetical protein SAMN04488693_105101 [Arthrobacter subterraneus]
MSAESDEPVLVLRADGARQKPQEAAEEAGSLLRIVFGYPLP